MRAAVACLFFGLFAGATWNAWAEEKAPTPKRPVLPVGVRWHGDLTEGLAQAAKSGRPIVFAINALEDESANNRLATHDYRSAAWGNATRNYVCFVCNPNEHPGPNGTCARYPGIQCKDHQDALKLVGKRYSAGELISPQHIILEPDQTLAYRKEYFTGIVGPGLFNRWLSAIAPSLAFAEAGIAREDRIKSLLSLTHEERIAQLGRLVSGDDGFAAAVVVHVLDEVSGSPAQRLALIATLSKAHRSQAGVVEYMSDETLAYPDDAPEEAAAWIRVLRAVHPSWGAHAAARSIARANDAAVRTKLLSAWGLGGKVAAMREPDRWMAWEALALSGDPRGGANVTALPADMAWRIRIERALHKGGLATGDRIVDLAGALSNGGQGGTDQGLLRRALWFCTAEQAKSHLQALEQLLVDNRYLGVRSAVAIALLRAGRETADASVSRTLQATLFDPVEGPDVRQAVRRILGEDPGTNVDEWIRMIALRTEKSK